MTQNREQLVAGIRGEILKNDIRLLDTLGCGDDVMEILAAEHAARCETLSKMIDPTMGRVLLLMTARALLDAANQVSAATVPGDVVGHA